MIPMTPEDIRSQRFNTRLLHGLSPDEVAAFLEDVAEAYARLQEANRTLTARVQALEEERLRTSVLAEVEALLRNAHTQVNAHLERVREQEAEILREAQARKACVEAEAEALLTSATARAEALVAAAQEQQAGLRAEIDRLTQSRLQLIDEVHATLETYQRWLATVDPRGRARGRRETLEATENSANSVTAAPEPVAG
jgi:DivIVA domain-containing protein